MVKAIITTWHNGDDFEIVIPKTGKTFTRFKSGKKKKATDIVCSSHNVAEVWGIINRRNITKRFGGNPFPGAPYWASNFCAAGEAELTDSDLAYLRRLHKLTQEADDPYTALYEAVYYGEEV